MEPLSRAGSRGTRLVLVAVALFALLAIVAFASRSGFGGSSDAKPSETYVSYAFSIFLVLFVLAIPVTVYAFYLKGREEAVRRKNSFARVVLQNLLTFFVFLGIAVFLFYVRHFHPHFLDPNRTPAARTAKALRKAGAKGRPFEPVFQWPVLYVAVPLLLATAVAGFVLYRRGKARRQGKVRVARPGVAADLSASISGAIDDLEAEPDARRAVIAAYARMEGALARHGIARRPSETPFEYLSRVLLDLRAPAEAVRRLTDAFERAKFSTHEIDVPAKREAIGALVAVRDALAGATT